MIYVFMMIHYCYCIMGVYHTNIKYNIYIFELEFIPQNIFVDVRPLKAITVKY